jgi:hypothetical protein
VLERKHKSTNAREDLLGALKTIKKLLTEKDVLTHAIILPTFYWGKDLDAMSEERTQELLRKLNETTSKPA